MSASSLRHFPPGLFGAVMGTAGLALALQRGRTMFGLPRWPGDVVIALAALMFVVVLLLYAVKAARYPAAVRQDLAHPVRLNFVPAISISMLLLAMGVEALAPAAARLLWIAGAVLHVVLTLVVLSGWIDRERVELAHVNPAWFLPAVGNILVPVTGARYVPAEIAWLFLGVGLLFWVVLLALVLQRLILLPPLPPRMQPMLAILVAPPAVGFLAYLALTNRADGFAFMLYGCALLFATLVLVRLPRLARLPFSLSWWGYSFPLAALTIATMAMHERTQNRAFLYLAMPLLAGLAVLIGALLVRTLIAVRRGEISVDEEAPHPAAAAAAAPKP